MTVSYHFAKVGFRQNTGTWYTLLHACNIVHTTTEDLMATNEVVVDERGRTSLAKSAATTTTAISSKNCLTAPSCSHPPSR